MIALTNHPIDTTQALAEVTSPNCGAIVLFLGTTRQWTAGRETTQLSYECYEEMAKKELEKLEVAARAKWTIEHCLIIHRLGVVPIAEASVLVAVSSPHRDAAFEAARYLIDTLKEQVPIWKKEHHIGGDAEWIHPTPTN
jgi:molybdopterin synthase catalytic subunit